MVLRAFFIDVLPLPSYPSAAGRTSEANPLASSAVQYCTVSDGSQQEKLQ